MVMAPTGVRPGRGYGDPLMLLTLIFAVVIKVPFIVLAVIDAVPMVLVEMEFVETLPPMMVLLTCKVLVDTLDVMREPAGASEPIVYVVM